MEKDQAAVKDAEAKRSMINSQVEAAEKARLAAVQQAGEKHDGATKCGLTLSGLFGNIQA